MSVRIVAMTESEVAARDDHETDRETDREIDEQAGLGAMVTGRGNLALDTLDAAVRIAGLVGQITLTQGFTNPHDVALEATYVFPLPDRAAVTAMRMTADGRTVAAELRERGRARQDYDRAIAAGQRASIAEEERPDVFTMRVGNILPAERVTVELIMVGPLSYADGEATFRLPLVVAPRYVPGAALDGEAVGDGYAQDTDAVPDASRVTPPVLLPGFPNPVRLSIGVDIDAAGLPLAEVRSSLHAVVTEGDHISVRPGERINRDFILRLAYGEPDAAAHSLTIVPDAAGGDAAGGDAAEGGRATFRLTILPPTAAALPRPRDLVLLLDRSGSMSGWKMVAARRAAARVVDTLTPADRFAVLAFDHAVEPPATLPPGLVAGTDRHRYRAVEHLGRMRARGGTELLAPLTMALALLTDPARDRVLVLVTDGQVGNEDQILARTGGSLAGVRVHTVGIDQAVNAGFLGRLASVGGGRCELVESEDRLDEAMQSIHRRIGAPVVTHLALETDGLAIIDDTVAPARLPDLFPGAPVVVTGRLRHAGGAAMATGAAIATGATGAAIATGAATGAAMATGTGAGGLTVRGRTGDGSDWSARLTPVTTRDAAVTAMWARAHLRDLEDAYVSADTAASAALERRLVDVSLRFGVLCRFTAWLAVDTRVVTDGGQVHRVIQPVEAPAGWEMFDAEGATPMMLAASAAPMASTAPMASAPMRFAPSTLAHGPRPGASRAAPAMPGGLVGRRRRGSAPVARPDELAAARAQVADEARRLRELEPAPPARRREALADLGTRLRALLRHLVGAGIGAAALAPLSGLLGELDADRPLRLPDAALDDLWVRTRRGLEEFAAGRPGAPRGTAPGKSGKPGESGELGKSGKSSTGTRREFWRRGG